MVHELVVVLLLKRSIPVHVVVNDKVLENNSESYNTNSDKENCTDSVPHF
jgi:hypothetical protein